MWLDLQIWSDRELIVGWVALAVKSRKYRSGHFVFWSFWVKTFKQVPGNPLVPLRLIETIPYTGNIVILFLTSDWIFLGWNVSWGELVVGPSPSSDEAVSSKLLCYTITCWCFRSNASGITILGVRRSFHWFPTRFVLLFSYCNLTSESYEIGCWKRP